MQKRKEKEKGKFPLCVIPYIWRKRKKYSKHEPGTDVGLTEAI